MKRTLWLLAALALVLSACKPDKPEPVPVDPNDTIPAVELKGVYVLNEGNYQFSNASLSFYDIEADTVYNNMFYKVNDVPLGDVAESMALVDGKLYVVVNNSNNIKKLDANTFVCDVTQPYIIEDFYSPREMHFVASDKAYVSDLMGTNLWIINPQTMTHTGTVEMGKTTEKMVQVGNELYVSNWSYYYLDANLHDSYNTVQVVDLNNDVKVAEIEVGKEPNTMVSDKNGHVWVLCEGRSWDVGYGELPSLWEIDPQLKTAQKRYEFDGTASVLKANPAGDQLYIIYNNEVRRFDLSTLSLSETFGIAPEPQGLFYNMAVDPKTGDIYVTDAKNYMMNGMVYRYSYEGVRLGSFEAGRIPSAMLFK